MKKTAHQTLKAFLASTLLLGLAACTKEVPYQEELKEQPVLAKASLPKGQLLFSSAMLNASRSSEDALPFASGDNKRVKLQWTKDSLRVIEVEQDARFKDNSTNDKLVLEIPVTHVQFACAKDKYGECTNTEEDQKIPWNEKGSFQFLPQASRSAALELLPILIDRSLGGSCYEEISSRLIDSKLEPTAINLSIERTFKVHIDCLSELRQIGDATVTAVFHYSMVQVDAVLSKDFKVVEYPVADQNTFGFFSTDRLILDASNNAVVTGKKTLMNHWNPNRTQIDYFLSDEFKKPEHAKIRELTFSTVGAINTGLKQAGAKFQINLQDGNGRNPGDNRNSMIVLVEDPVAASIIGYGPQTEDPMTGEIISARTVMFLGTIKKYIKYTYEEILRENKTQTVLANAKAGGVSLGGGLKLDEALTGKVAKTVKNAGSAANVKTKVTAVAKAPVKIGIDKSGAIEKSVRAYTKNVNSEYSGSVNAMYKYLNEAKNCALASPADRMTSTGISQALKDKFANATKPWDSLTEAEKQAVIDIILPEVWVPTLIHELGHNLGLRHNFQGSEDKANFYSEAELKALNIDRAIPFSSVMEYGDDLKALPVMGKYDIAALKYAYQKQIELADGSMVAVNENISKMKKANPSLALKEYGYCTDEQTGVNAGCRRFDLGTSYTEIIQNEIQSYLENYKSRNFRNGRESFSLVEDASYAARIYHKFEGMRLMQEVYERIKNTYGLADDAPEWEQIAFLKDLKDASKLTADFLQSVLITPDLTCAVAQASNPTQIVQVAPLVAISPDAISCFGLELNPAFKIVGQYGKLFNSGKDPLSENSYADQIDVRGYWIDKLMASRVLFKRSLGVSTLDKFTDNFMDRSDIAQNLGMLSMSMLLNQISAPQELELEDGSVVELALPMDLHSTMRVEKPLFAGLARAIGIPNDSVHFNQLVAGETAKNMIDSVHSISGRPFADALKVSRVKATDSFKKPAGYLTLNIGTEVLLAGPSNAVAFESIKSINIIETLSKVDEARLALILTALKESTPLPAPLSKEETAASKLAVEDIEAFTNGLLQKPAFYQELVNILPN